MEVEPSSDKAHIASRPRQFDSIQPLPPLRCCLVHPIFLSVTPAFISIQHERTRQRRAHRLRG